MASSSNTPAGPDSLISVKISVEGGSRKFKIPLRELAPPFLFEKLRSLLDLPPNQLVRFERFSDSAGAYIALDPVNPTAFKSLLRAAKAKHKLRLRTVFPAESSTTRGPLLSFEPRSFDAFLAANNSQQTLVNNPAISQPVPAVRPILPMDIPTEKPEGSKILKPTIGMPVCSRSSIGAISKRHSARLDRQHNMDVVRAINKVDRRSKPYMGPAPVKKEDKIPIASSWSVFCNACDQPMDNEHYHCNICDDGDYDLCQGCVEAGIHCRGTGHWLIKRTIQNGRVVSSQTTTMPPKVEVEEEILVEAVSPVMSRMPEMPGAFTDDKKSDTHDHVEAEPSRTCNNCIEVLAENQFVTCLDCEDFDLCLQCHENNSHGHHPAHTFKPVNSHSNLSPVGAFLCAPGRNVRHAALCDGCDKSIFGVRHKCLNCPDWDYCSACYKNVKFIHAGHRFVPIYEPIAEPRYNFTRHYGIYCDGPLCKDKHETIGGIRYKCAICDDTDFCAACEATPENRHNRTHPLIMFKTPVRNVSITTIGDDSDGVPMRPMGDTVRRCPAMPNHSASRVQTIVDLKPTEASAPVPATPLNKIEIKDLLAEPIEEKIKVEEVEEPLKFEEVEELLKPSTFSANTTRAFKRSELSAHYVRDTIADGSIMPPNKEFVQVWTLTNPGPHAWPAGCTVRFVGGDGMRNIDSVHPSSVAALDAASGSNTIDRAVAVGETVDFRVAMRAPSREGTAISYWRLKTADGFPFGHRLWCHIKVVAPPLSFPDMRSALLPTSSPVAVPDLTEMVKALQARTLAANAGVEAAKFATQTKNVLESVFKPLDQSAREFEDLKKTLNSLMGGRVSQVFQSPAESSKTPAELPVERSAVELDKSVQAATSEPERKSRIVVIPVRGGKESAKGKEVVRPDASPVITTAPQPASVEAVADEEDGSAKPAPSEVSSSSSTMIFPTLEKESPAASVHHEQQSAAASAAPVVSAVLSPAPTRALLESDDEDDDAESVVIFEGGVDFVDDDSEEDGEEVFTDEEYDFLDGSDEEGL